jgi:hypothetical protein
MLGIGCPDRHPLTVHPLTATAKEPTNHDARNPARAGSFDGPFSDLGRHQPKSTVDQDLAVVLLDLRRQLRDEYGTGPAVIMLIDRAIGAYQDFLRVTGWVGNLAIHIERELFGPDAPRAEFQGRSIRGLTVEQHLAHLREGLLPLAERCGRVMREALSALEALRSGPSEAVERSRPLRIAFKL